MALALMGMPLQDTSRGTLPPETNAWRNALGLPSAQAMAGARERAVGLRGVRASQELEHAWTAWMSELTSWFCLIDEEFLKNHPQWLDCKGRWWHPLLDGEQVKPMAARKEAGAGPVSNTSKEPNAKKVRKKPTNKTRVVADIGLDYPPIRISPNLMKQQWDEPLPSETRSHLWDAGVQALGGSEKAARSLLGSLIKDFGEGAVAEAVAKLAVRANRPADPIAFLRKQVAIQAGESPAARAASAARSKVSL